MIAHLDCFSGISGDMTLGALLSLGADETGFRRAMDSLGLSGFDISITDENRGGLSGKRVSVNVTEPQPERHLSDIRKIIEGAAIPESVKARALAVFTRLAEAEAGVHGTTPDHVHFHEVGAVDAIIDVTGAAWLIEALGITRLTSSLLPMGTGLIKCAHGVLPNPAPATVRLLKGVPVYGVDAAFEFVTPTGAAIASTFCESFGPMPEMTISATGFGFGSAVLSRGPNALRVFLGQPSASLDHDRVAVISTEIDDMNPEIYGFLMERLLSEGALDVMFIPVQMKKSRPATLVEVVCPPELRDRLIRLILSETTTIGVRWCEAARTKLVRRVVTVSTPFGDIAAKEVVMPDGSIRVTPEYESCRRAALANGAPIQEIYRAVAGSGV